jgi:DNA-binding Lrp family transcriptional regulator
MWLTKNEKKVLKLLVDNAKLSDTSIANQLDISSQAVGKIRKKLEEEIIEKYTVKLDLKKLGLNLFIMGRASVKIEEDISIEEIEERLQNVENNTSIFKLIKGTNEYLFASLYKDIDDLQKFIENEHKTQKVAPNIKIEEMQEIPLSNVLKTCSFEGIYKKAIDELGVKHENINF